MMQRPWIYLGIALGCFLVLACSSTSTVSNNTGDSSQGDALDSTSDWEIRFQDTHIKDTWPFDFDEEDIDVVEEIDLIDVLVDVPPDVPADLTDADSEGDEDQLDVADEKDEHVVPDGDCNPSCSGKDCGPDGCGGVCGFCQYGFICSTGSCVESVCQTDCIVTVDSEETYKECGPDDCGGFCGFCLGESTYCGDDGFCYEGSCDGSCAGRVCGDDGCGHSCGNCQVQELCDPDGQCIPHPCGDVTYKGKCTSQYILVECLSLQLVETNCKTIQDRMCGWDEGVGKYSCIQETECVPQCTFDNGMLKECGPNGCWGECGVCPDGWSCQENHCQPEIGAECAWIDGIIGMCSDGVRWFCSEGLLYGYDCMANEGKNCGWKASANGGAGGYDCL